MNKTFGIIVGFVVTALLGAGIATVSTVYYFKSKSPAPLSAQTQDALQQQQSVQSQYPAEQQNQPSPSTPPSQEPIQDAGVVWLPKPQKIAQDLKLFKIPDSAVVPSDQLPPGEKPIQKDQLIENVTYHKTGTDNGYDIIIAEIPPDGPGSDYRAYLRKTPKGTYEYIQQNSNNYDGENKTFYGGQPISAVAINTQTVYASVQTQKTLSYKNVVLENIGDWLNIDETFAPSPRSEGQRTRVAQTPYGILYAQTKEGLANGMIIQSFVLEKPNGLTEMYQYTPSDILHDNGVADVTWNDGKKNTDTFMVLNTTGCGAGAYLPLLAESEVSALSPIGKTAKGEVVYGPSNPNHPIIQYLYRTSGGAYYDGSGKSNKITLKEFQNVHPVLLAKDALGRYVIYNNSTWGPAAECGKPVIYLYPQQPTNVSVRVGATITASDPQYDNGWNVSALPDGTLYQNNTRYDSLFWEGIGQGIYPIIQRGIVVKSDTVEQTLRAQLAQLGLNKKESSDFLAFWLPRMPQSPYIRLSWLQTTDMNALAPISITPRPDTMIRVFLDFEGLEHFVDLPAQHLSARPRNGFTVIEWGGLLKR